MKLDWLGIVAILGTVGTFVGIVLTMIYARRSERQKMLVYETGSPLALASVLPARTEHRLSIVYQREGSPPENVTGAYLYFLRLANLGKEPIRREDLAPGDPPRLEVSDARVLDIALASISREVINLSLESLATTSAGAATRRISFDFLDHEDGAVIRILTDKPRARLRVLGTVIGMPQGILPINRIGPGKLLNALGCTLAVILQLSAIAGSLYLFHHATGGWSLLWVYLLPVGALLVPSMIVAIISATIWPKGARWPRGLTLPEWFSHSRVITQDLTRRRHLEMDLAERLALLQELEDPSASNSGHGA